MKRLLLLASIALVSLSHASEMKAEKVDYTNKTILSFMIDQYNDKETKFRFYSEYFGQIEMVGSDFEASLLEKINMTSRYVFFCNPPVDVYYDDNKDCCKLKSFELDQKAKISFASFTTFITLDEFLELAKKNKNKIPELC